MEVRVERIGPEQALQLLEANHANRKIRESLVDRYAGAMTRGEWHMNGDPIRQDKNSNLLDGQHRLMSVLRSGKTIEFVFISGLEPESQTTMDIGARRNLADILQMRGESHPHMLSTAVRYFWFYLEAKSFRKPKTLPTHQQLLATLEDHNIRTSFKPAQRVRSAGLMPMTIAVPLHYVFASVDKDEADAFFDRLASGLLLDTGDPILLLRTALIRENARRQRRLEPYVIAAWTIKAFNAWREGRTVRQLHWKGGGQTREPFPLVTDCPFHEETAPLDLTLPQGNGSPPRKVKSLA